MKKAIISKIFEYIIIFLILLVVAASLLWFVRAFNIFDLPEGLEKLFYNQSDFVSESDEIEENVISLIQNNDFLDFDDNYSFLPLAPEKITELLSDFDYLDSYFWEVETSAGTDVVNHKQVHKIYKKNEKIRVDTTDAYSDVTTIFLDDLTYIKNNKTGDVRKISGDTDFSHDNVVNIAALDYLFSDSSVEVTLVEVSSHDDVKYLYVEVPKSSGLGIDKFYISLENGLVYFATSEINNKIIFSQKTLNFDKVSIISDEMFNITD